MGLNLNRLTVQEAANLTANPLILSKTINFDGTGNNGKILTAATLSTNLTGSNNDIDYTAATSGLAGNSITVAYVDPGTAGAALSVSVTGSAITVNLATDSAAKATGTLTSTGTAPANNDTVTVGPITYTFKTTLTGAANEVLIGASAAIALDNLKSAVQGTAGEGTTYGTGTIANYAVEATTNTDTTQVFEATYAGTDGNSVVTTEASSQLSFGAATLTGGLAGGSITSTGDDIKTAIAGNVDANALVSTADKAGNDGSGIVTAMAATALAGGSDGYIDLFTVEEDFTGVVWGACKEDLAGATATLSVGIAGATTALLGAQTATNIDNGEAWDTTGIIAAGVVPNAEPFYFIQSGSTIRAYVGTASITDGSITFYALLERPAPAESATLSGALPAGNNNIGDVDIAGGNVASGAADSGNPVKVGGRNNTTKPTLTDGQRGDLQLDSRANLNVSLYGAGSTTGAVASSSGADGVSNSTAGINIYTLPRYFNATSWDRQYNNFEATILASAARTATTNGTDQTNFNGKGVMFILNVTAEAAAETLSLKIQVKDPVSGNYTDYTDFGVIYDAATNAPGAFAAVAYPGVTAADFAAGVRPKAVSLPRTFRVVVTHSASGSWTYSLASIVLV